MSWRTSLLLLLLMPGGWSCSDEAAAPAGTAGATSSTTSGGSGGGTTNVGGTAGSGGEAGSGGGGGSWTPPTGEPIDAPDFEWTWIDFPDAKCRDGSTTGIGVNLNSASTEVLIYLQGGGACFNPVTCNANRSSYGEADFAPPDAGLFDREAPDNPTADFNFVYVPYCTGDLHAGNNPAGDVPQVGTQQFVGYVNMGHFLDRIVPTFLDATLVLLTGSSAGGFGATSNSKQVLSTFGPTPVYVLNDSGPPLNDPYLATCLQQMWRSLWGLDATLLAACGGDCPDQDEYFVDWMVHVANHYPNRPFGLISSRRDLVVRAYFGLGENDCQSTLPMAPLTFEQGLDDLKTTLQSRAPNFGTYLIPGTEHTFVQLARLYSTSVDGTALTAWIDQLLAGSAAHVAP